MKLYQNILLTWFPFLVINLVGAMTLPEDLSARICRMLLGDLSALLAVVSLFLFRREIVKETRLFFLMLAGLFSLGGLLFGLFLVTKRWLMPLDEWAVFYEYQYQAQIYFLLLSGCVIYLIVDLSLRGLSKSQKYVLAFVVAGSVWGYLFYPYYANPKYLYTTSDVEDYRAIRATTEDLRRGGVMNPSPKEIAFQVSHYVPESAKLGIRRSTMDRVARVSEVLPYFRGDDISLLIFRPFWRACIVMASLSIVSILLFILYQYLADPPKSAYMEKVLWCLLPFCCFEALHHYAFVQVNHFEDFLALNLLGIYLSMGVMLALLLLLILRLRFIQSIEGRFYENRLIADATRITRWRDAFDNWILRQFMNPNELKQRFVTQSKEDTTKDITGDGL
jgi:hypothetical protein